ncbi:uncharacterized protein LOC132393135 isoform X3 [Hypanus sabinus]|uniref:uncharacterized protein LOC132393135 isoform X3 n=1 Tax=Hypanus sabinus TaxID=79690 RepID=UPI0028C3CEE8|nr:uncharacterized protein LOC132393135 isoform X3 [Hypanus sabinus]
MEMHEENCLGINQHVSVFSPLPVGSVYACFPTFCVRLGLGKNWSSGFVQVAGCKAAPNRLAKPSASGVCGRQFPREKAHDADGCTDHLHQAFVGKRERGENSAIRQRGKRSTAFARRPLSAFVRALRMEADRAASAQPDVKAEEEIEALIFDGAEVVDIHNMQVPQRVLSVNSVPSTLHESDEQRRCLATLVYLKNTRNNNPGECSTARVDLSNVEPESTGHQEQPLTGNRRAQLITQPCGLRSGKRKTFAPSSTQMGKPANYNEVRTKKKRLHSMVRSPALRRLSDDEDYEEYYDEESDAMPDNVSDLSDSSENLGQQTSLMEVINYCQVIYSAIRRLDRKVEVIQRKVSNLRQGKTRYFTKQRQVLASLSNGYNQTLKRKMVLKSNGNIRKKRITSSNPSYQSEPNYSNDPIIIQDEEDVADVIVDEKPNEPATFHSTEQILKNMMPPANSAVPGQVVQPPVLNSDLQQPSQRLQSMPVTYKMNKIPNSHCQRPVLQQLEIKKTFQPIEDAHQSNDSSPDHCNTLEHLRRDLMLHDPSFDLSKNSFEFLSKQFPHHDLTEVGKDWKICISAINNMISTTRRRVETGSNQRREYLSDEKASTSSISPSTSDSAANGQLWWLYQNPTPLSPAKSQKTYEKLECLGRSDRKVELPASVIHLAKQRTRPELAARFLTRHLFPDSVLLRSNVYGAIRKGKAPLDCNKINAVREFLAECFTGFDLAEDGKDWKVCVDAINGVIRCLRYELKKTPQGRSFLKHYSSPVPGQTEME